MGGIPAARWAKDRGNAEVFRCLHRSVRHRPSDAVGVGANTGGGIDTLARPALGRFGDFTHHAHGFVRKQADGGFFREHQGVGAIEYRVGHVVHFGTRR